MIRVANLRKVFRVHERPAGIWAAARSVFHRSWSEVAAVERITFHVQPGERVGFLGPNGAGKTTTLKMLSGLLHPTEGSVRVDGHEPRRREEAFLKKIMLVLGQKQQLLWDLPAADTFELNRAVYGVSRGDFDETMRELGELLDLPKLAGKPVRTLSLGERMKCELAAALLHRPKVLFLDEPTIGLDVTMQASVRDFVRRYNERSGATVLLTSHDMNEVRALCPRVVVIDVGRIVYDGSLDALVRRMHPTKRVVLRLSKPVARSRLARFGEVRRHDALEAALDVPHAAVKATLGRLLASLPVADLSVDDPPLEQVMDALFAKSRAEREALAAEREARSARGGEDA